MAIQATARSYSKVIPARLQERGLTTSHPYPLVSDGKREGRAFRSWRVPAIEAWKFPSLQINGSVVRVIVLDADDPERCEAAIQNGDAPEPSVRVVRVSNEHRHIFYILENPVAIHSESRREPVAYLRGVSEYLTNATGSDPRYAGVLAHNPVAKPGAGLKTVWGRGKPYSLGELAEVIPLGWKPPKVAESGIGRNVDVFEAAMRWAGRRENLEYDVLAAVSSINRNLPNPLPVSEERSIARSVDKCRRRWERQGWHSPAFIAKQKARGKKGGAKSKRKPMADSAKTVRPWEAEGISRATWYRRRKKAKEGAQAGQMAIFGSETG